ncbi:MAG: hypothetical protein IMF08_13505 [Proteobacteria bacterium]|nr:hypothetical protein [Pseudomonadota bacterium]
MSMQDNDMAAGGRPAWREVGGGRLAILALLLLGHLLFSIFAVAPGHFVSDEGKYHQMAKAFAEDQSLTLWREYRDFPSPELRTWNHLPGKDGSLQSQYPYLHPVLAWPFYKMAGFRGLFAMSAIAYVALAGICFLLCKRLWRDPRIAADSVILLTLGSYAWQYSQAAWSQTLASTFLLAGVWFGVCAVQAVDRRAALLYGWAAGMVVGLGAGIRLDVFFMAPALFIPLLYDRAPRWRVAGAALVGLLPGLLLLSLTNYAKFGTLNPLSYGRSAGSLSISGYIPLLSMGLVVLSAAWIGSRDAVWAILVRHRLALSAAGVVLASGLVFLVPTFSGMLLRLTRGAWILVADLSLLAPSVGGLGVTRGPLGSIMYADTVKKALLQSLPWLPVALLAVIGVPRLRASVLAHSIPLLAVMAFLTVYGWQAWHGGYAFNLRYFVPLLPIFAVYGAMGIHMLLREDDSPKLRFAAALTAVTAGVAWLFMLFRDTEIESIEAVTLKLPLFLAAVLSVLLVLFVARRGLTTVRRLAFLASFACLAWAFVMALLMDFPRTWFLRQHRYETGVFLATHVPRDSMLFANYDPASFALTDVPGARNAWVSMDEYRDSRKILDMSLAAGRPILAFFSDEDWVEFREHGMLDGMEAVEIAEGPNATLYRLKPVEILTNGQTQ